MDALPSSVEAYLFQAGFSGTEVLILKRLIEADGLTLRELAAKTGKSTGVLDQAMKKLLRKKIVTRERMNDGYKFAMISLQSIVKWMEQDTKQKREMLLRRHQNFEQFIASLQHDKGRPEMEFYEGDEGLQKAYLRLLDLVGIEQGYGPGREMLFYVPVQWKEEEDPLRDFRVQYFRERRRRGIFSRMIAPKTPLGMRYQNRDPFEYRKTVLVPEDRYQFAFEKVIVGDTVACINHKEKKACFVRYPELAETERSMFEGLWKQESEREKSEAGGGAAGASAGAAAPARPTQEEIPIKTRTFSQLRDFFLSRTSLITLGFFALVSAMLTYGLYQYTANLNLERTRERVKSIAATGVFQFDPKDIEALQVERDWKKPEWARVVNQLKGMRRNNEDIFFVYIFRRSKQDYNKLEFVADSHSINPYANTDDDPNNNVDVDSNGIINSIDVLQWPGQPYPTPNDEIFNGFKGPTATRNYYTDSWGSYLTGYAPIKNSNGNTVAVLAVDFSVNKLRELIFKTFTPIWYFLGFFLLFIFIRLGAFNRVLFSELWQAFQMKSVFSTFLLFCIVSGVITYGLYQHNKYLNLQRVKEKVLSIAATGALQFDANDLNKLHIKGDIARPEYAKVIAKENDIRDQNPGVKYIYIMRPTKDSKYFEFVADADSLDINAKKDLNGDGVIDDADHLSPPGEPYNVEKSVRNAEQALKVPTAFDPYIDQWGTLVSGWAPIRDSNGKTVAVLGIDKFASDVEGLAQSTFSPVAYFFSLLLLFILIRLVIFNRNLFANVLFLLRQRNVLITIAICGELAFFLTLGMYVYTLKLIREEVGARLLSTAVIGASRISPEDLSVLRFARDMRRPEYQRVFNQLNEIRRSNKEVKWTYVMRPTNTPSIWEFVADADSNYTLPACEDFDRDGIIDESAECNVAPGVQYDTSNDASFEEAWKEAFIQKQLYTDQWGTYISAYAPIKIKIGETIAILGLDSDITDIKYLTLQKFSVGFWFFGLFVFLLTLRILMLKA